MKLLVHVGTTKTGSTSIQAFLNQNRKSLSERGVHFVNCLGTHNQRAATVFATDLEETPDLHASLGLRSDEIARRYKDDLALEFADEIRQYAHLPLAVITNEHLHSRVHRPESFDRLLTLFGDRFESIDVICYLRPQLDHVVSLYTTMVAHGKPFTIDEFLLRRIDKAGDHYFNFERFLRPWVDRFGRDHVDVALFDDQRTREHGVLSDFGLRVLLAPDDPEAKLPDRRNLSVSALGQHLLYMRARVEKPVRRKYPRVDRLFVRWIRNDLAGAGALPSPGVADQFHRAFASGNEWVRQTWFPDRDVILVPDWTKYHDASGVPPASALADFDVAALYRPGHIGKKAERVRGQAERLRADDPVAADALERLAKRLSPDG